jgi:peptidyl-prolyl cis-trans isomerase A (cyclophilin A)
MRLCVNTRGAAACVLLMGFLLGGCFEENCGAATELPQSRAVLLYPDSAAFKVIPPERFRVLLATSEGDVVLEVVRAWSPMGAYRFYNLVRNGFFDGSRFYRVIPGFAAQFGVSGYPAVEKAWRDAEIPGDPIRVSNTRGMVTFAQVSRESRNTQLFINLADNQQLDAENFAPIGRVISGWDAVLRLTGEYGDLQPAGDGPRWRCVYTAGNRYLRKYYPQLDSILRARVTVPAV